MGALDIYSTPFGRFLLDPDDGVQAHIAFSGTPWDAWIQPLIEKYAPGKLCFDVGAHVGSMSMLMVNAGATRVIAFEPQARLFGQLQATALLNSSKITPSQRAVWDQGGLIVSIAVAKMEETCPLDPDWRVNSPGSIAFARGLSENPVYTTTVDTCACIYGAPGFIKIDAQGADLLVLRGGIETITDARPVIIFEYEDKLARDLHGHTWADYKEFFYHCGYSLTTADPNNFLALPKEA